jgi:hypothetical protein
MTKKMKAEERKDIVLHFVVTKGESAAIHAAAARAERSLSSWLRLTSLAAAKKP